MPGSSHRCAVACPNEDIFWSSNYTLERCLLPGSCIQYPSSCPSFPRICILLSRQWRRHGPTGMDFSLVPFFVLYVLRMLKPMAMLRCIRQMLKPKWAFCTRPMVCSMSTQRRVPDHYPGLGAFASPLVATQFAQMKHWSFHYLCSLGIAVSNVVCIALVFRLKDQDGML